MVKETELLGVGQRDGPSREGLSRIGWDGWICVCVCVCMYVCVECTACCVLRTLTRNWNSELGRGYVQKKRWGFLAF